MENFQVPTVCPRGPICDAKIEIQVPKRINAHYELHKTAKIYKKTKYKDQMV